MSSNHTNSLPPHQNAQHQSLHFNTGKLHDILNRKRSMQLNRTYRIPASLSHYSAGCTGPGTISRRSRCRPRLSVLCRLSDNLTIGYYPTFNTIWGNALGQIVTLIDANAFYWYRLGVISVVAARLAVISLLASVVLLVSVNYVNSAVWRARESVKLPPVVYCELFDNS